MNEDKNNGMSLRDALASGFERMAAEEAVEQAEQEQSAPAEQPTEPAHDPAAENGVPANAAEQAAAADVSRTAPAETPAPTAGAQNGNMMGAIMQTLMALREENAQLRAARQQSQAALEQQSTLAEEAAVNTVAEPQIPALDIKALQYMSDEEQAAAVSAWQNAVMEGAVQKAMGAADAKYANVLKDYGERTRMAADQAARTVISGRADFPDFAANAQFIDRIAATPEFQSMNPEKRYMFAALAARGMAHNPSAQPSVDEIVQMAVSNPDVMKALETRRAQEVQRTNAALPTLSASSGMGGASAIPESRVQTREDLERKMRSRFGL